MEISKGFRVQFGIIYMVSEMSESYVYNV